ncbi:hypothetical protein [Luteimonas sp. SDU101]|uniref:hypothetical protein n=1 Tax=unclassified Luteimonas TaxID=2629088 RepID=UPI003EBAD2DC
MSRSLRSSTSLALCSALLFAGCASGPDAAQAPGASTIEGTIASIDTAPWAYDGHAVIQVDAGQRGRVAVQLPARWNLCRAAAVDVEALAVGMRVIAVGAEAADGGLVVCEDAAHRLQPAN